MAGGNTTLWSRGTDLIVKLPTQSHSRLRPFPYRLCVVVVVVGVRVAVVVVALFISLKTVGKGALFMGTPMVVGISHTPNLASRF